MAQAGKKGSSGRRSGAGSSRSSRSGGAAARRQTARKTARASAGAAAKPAEFSGKTVAEFREALTRNLIRPLEMVLLTRDRIQEAFDDAVRRGRMTADDADELVRGLVERGRRQTNDVLRDLEQLLGRGQTEVRSAGRRARGQVRQAKSRARKAADPVLAQADRARRAAGVGSSFPISGYDDLSAAQIQSRLGDLTPAELRKVRDYERRHGNRKSVLAAIEKKLA